MQSIKYRAHRHARKGDGGGRFNPFRRPAQRSSSMLGKPEDDLEMNRVKSEADLEMIAERNRREDVEEQSPMAFKHSNTAPPTSASTENPPSPQFPRAPTTANGKTFTSDAGNSETLMIEKERSTAIVNEGARPRKGLAKLGGFLHREKSDSDDEKEKKQKKKPERKFTIWEQIRALFFESWINILLILVPIGIALNYVDSVPRIAVFIINFLAIMPLAGMLSFSTEQLALRVGETLGGLLNASFGNAVELIVSIIALFQNQFKIVKTSLIGSMLSNLLLVLGMCFFFGGLKRDEQFFNSTVASTSASLLALAVGSLLIPTVFLSWGNSGTMEERAAKIPQLSRGTAVLLLLVYASYLIFQLFTHKHTFSETGGKATERTYNVGKGATKRAVATLGAGAAQQGQGDQMIFEDPDDEEEPQLSVVGSVVALLGATVLIGFTAEYMVDSIGAVTGQYHVSAEFVGLILIPIVGNAAEHVTAVTVAYKDKMDLAIGVAVGSSLQIALLVLPLAEVIGWIAKKDQGDFAGLYTDAQNRGLVKGMNLDFDGFLLAVLIVTVFLVNYLIVDGRSHWLEGVLLMITYTLIATAAWFYPADDDVRG